MITIEPGNSDGRSLVLNGLRGALWELRFEGNRKPTMLRGNGVMRMGMQSRLSPDRKWIAQTLRQPAQFEVYVLPTGAASGRWQVPNMGGFSPQWRADGRELYYWEPITNRILAVDVAVTGDRIQPSTPRELFRMVGGVLGFSATGDGQRFPVKVPSGPAPGPEPLNVVVNWQAGVKR